MDQSRRCTDAELLMRKAQSPGSYVSSLNVDWPTDLSGRGEALWDLFEPQRSTFHCEAVAATGGGASQRCPEDAGHHDECGEPPEAHDGFTVGFCASAEKEHVNQYNLGKNEFPHIKRVNRSHWYIEGADERGKTA